MKKLILYIVLISFGMAATAAPLRYCKKAGKALAAHAIRIPAPAPQEEEKTPSQNSEVCPPSTLVFLHSPQQVTKPLHKIVLLHLTGYRTPFHPQYVANPPFAPPRASFV